MILITLATAAVTISRRRRRWLAPAIVATYVLAVVLVGMVSPQVIISVGDSYCWDLWCLGIQKVQAQPQGANTLYTAEVSLSVDSDTAELALSGKPNDFFYAIDERGRRFPILSFSPPSDANTTVKPARPVTGTFKVLAPADAGRLYLTGDVNAPLWVRLYFASDLNFFHRRTLLRIA